MLKLTLIACLVAIFICTAKAGEFHTSEKGDLFYVERDLNVTWYEALHECSIRNMSLLTPDTKKKELEILEFISSLDMWNQWWTAGMEIHNLEFMWITTGDSLTYSNWGMGEPERLGSDNNAQCIGMLGHQWGSFQCNDLIYFICEENPILKEKKLKLNALKTNQRATNNQLDDSRQPHSNDMQDLIESRKKLACDNHIIIELDKLWKSHGKQSENLLDEKQREISDLKNQNEQYLNQLSLAKAQLELKSKEIEMVKQYNEIKLQLLEAKYNFTQDQNSLKVCSNLSQN